MIAEIVAQHIEEVAGGDYSADVARMVVAVIADVLPEVLTLEDHEQRLHEAAALSKVATFLKEKYQLNNVPKKSNHEPRFRDVAEFSQSQ